MAMFDACRRAEFAWALQRVASLCVARRDRRDGLLDQLTERHLRSYSRARWNVDGVDK